MKYVIANWKMNMVLEDIKSWYTKFSESLNRYGMSQDIQIILAPASVHIPIVKEVFKDLPVKIASQDVSRYDKGAHTGSLGSFQLKEFCDYCIVGHSERNEDMQTVLEKRDMVIKNSLTPIVCFTDPKDCVKVYTQNSLIAWEDPSNISLNGNYRPKDPGEIDEQSKMIINMLPEDAVLIYGGSVNKDNVAGLNSMEHIKGLLIGNASLDPEHFYEIALKFGA